MTTITVHVTQQDIADGVRHSVTRCPVALGMKRRMGRNDIRVMAARIYLGDGSTKWLPLPVQHAITEYDKTLMMAPFSFELEMDLTLYDQLHMSLFGKDA